MKGDLMASKPTSKFSSRDYFTLEFIPFVTSSQETKIVKDAPKSYLTPVASFNGKDASEYYKNVIALPPTTKPCTSNSSVTEKSKKLTSVISNSCSSKNIHKYAQDGNFKAIQQCLEKDKQYLINKQDMYGWTPLMCAACEGHLSSVKYLIESGADLSIKNKQGMTAIDIAHEKQHFDIVQLFENGVQPVKEKSVQSVELKEMFCQTCKLSFKESATSHERSIAHLFSAKKSDLSTFYHIPENNKGFQMMLRSGWDKNKGLGSKEEGMKFPVKTILKKDRGCIGRSKEIARVTHFNANDSSSIKRISTPPMKVVRERTLKKWQRAKLEKKNRQKEIEFRRQFIYDF